MNIRMRSIGLRLQMATALALIAVAVVLVTVYVLQAAQIQNGRIELLRSIGQSAQAIAASYEREQQAGHLTQAEAQHSAAQAIGALRYFGEEYVWINDMHPTMVMHPMKPSLDGTDITELKDPNGKRLFVSAVEAVRANGSGMVDYLWPRPGASEPVPKLSYVIGFQPWGWVIGTGVYVDDLVAAKLRLALVLAGMGLAVGLLLGAVLWRIGRGVTAPLQALTTATDRIAAGDLAGDIPGLGRVDELGALAKALGVLKVNSEARITLERHATDERAARDRRQAAMDVHTSDFGETVSGVLSQLAQSAANMTATAQQMNDGTERTRSSIGRTAAGSNESARELATVASATVQLSASIDEIARQVVNVSQATQTAVGRAADTDSSFVRLNQGAQRIGDIVGVISGIAAQTNLLALNATIEAARAGEAGRGFAVVANEVKALATQTTQAATEIVHNINEIMTSIAQTSGAIHHVSAAIHIVDEVASAIAAAIEEQGAATREIAASVQAVAETGERGSHVLSDVAGIAEQTGAMGQTVLIASDHLSDVSATLRTEVDAFFQAMPQEEAVRRRYERIDGHGAPITLSLAGGQSYPGTIKDISRGGAALRVAWAGSAGQKLKLKVAGMSAAIDARMLRGDAGVLAVVFGQGASNLAQVDSVIESLSANRDRANAA